MKLAAILFLCFTLLGCQGYLSLVEGLNQRELQSCIRYNGSMRVGAVSGGHVAISGLTATGGAPIDTCYEMFGFME